MDNLLEILVIIALTLILGSIFFYALNRRGPWGSFWTFLLILFLGIVLTEAWISPIGPTWYGTAWIDLLFIGLFFALLLGAASPTYDRRRIVSDNKESTEPEVYAVGAFFWIFIIFILFAIAAGISYSV